MNWDWNWLGPILNAISAGAVNVAYQRGLVEGLKLGAAAAIFGLFLGYLFGRWKR